MKTTNPLARNPTNAQAGNHPTWKALAQPYLLGTVRVLKPAQLLAQFLLSWTRCYSHCHPVSLGT